MAGVTTEGGATKSPFREIVQPFIDVARAPRALWGVNFGYFLEGFVYFGILGYLAMHFSDFVFRGVPDPDVHSHHMVMVLTAGITIAMFFLGVIPDRYGVRRALLWAFVLLLAGRVVIASARPCSASSRRGSGPPCTS
ncbi:MAG: peptide MFS transporter [Acidobacteria bacterium]|nr:peptide MFS transporter [Acidobacteriota bacterium]